MFGDEELESAFARLVSKSSPVQPSRIHRGSFAALLAFIKNRIVSDWPAATKRLVNLIGQDCGILGQHYIQELFVQLHQFDLFSTEEILRPQSAVTSWTSPPSLYGRSDLPPTLCITLKVSMTSLRVFLDLRSTPSKLGGPNLHGIVKSSPRSKIAPWMKCFAAVQLCFGDLVGSDEQSILG